MGPPASTWGRGLGHEPSCPWGRPSPADDRPERWPWRLRQPRPAPEPGHLPVCLPRGERPGVYDPASLGEQERRREPLVGIPAHGLAQERLDHLAGRDLHPAERALVKPPGRDVERVGVDALAGRSLRADPSPGLHAKGARRRLHEDGQEDAGLRTNSGQVGGAPGRDFRLRGPGRAGNPHWSAECRMSDVGEPPLGYAVARWLFARDMAGDMRQ